MWRLRTGREWWGLRVEGQLERGFGGMGEIEMVKG